jgi:hypothetical protein
LALGTGLGTTAETQIGARKNTCEIDDRNQIKEQYISSQIFYRTPGGRVGETTTEEQFEPQNIESFYPMTQELNRDSPATIHPIGKQNNRPAVTLEQDPRSYKSRFYTGYSGQEHHWLDALR